MTPTHRPRDRSGAGTADHAVPPQEASVGARRLFSVEVLGLVALYGFTAASVAGFGLFGLNPELLPDSDLARWVYRSSFPLFGRGHVVLTVLVLFAVLFRRAGLQWLPALALVYGASFLSEHLGTGHGVPFGPYRYTGLLGPKLLGRVPALIPLSWFVMAAASFALAGRLLPRRTTSPVRRILLGAWLLTAWDLALDPAMSHVTAYWRWEAAGPYYGMPWINLLGWAVTGSVLMGILETLGSGRWTERIPAWWWAALYGGVLLLPLGMLATAGSWPAVAVTGTAVALPWVGLRLREAVPSAESPSVPAPGGAA